MAGGERYLYVIDYVNHLGDSLSGLRCEIEVTPNLRQLKPNSPPYVLDEIEHYVSEIHRAANAFDPLFQDNEEQDLLADIRLFASHISEGRSPNQLTHPVSNKIKHLPNLETFYKLFSWLDKVTKIIDGKKDSEFFNKVQEAKGIFERQLKPLINAMQRIFTVSIRNDLLNTTKEGLKKYSWLKTALKEDSETLLRLGVDEETQAELSEIINPEVIQGHFEYEDVKVAFNHLSERLNSGSLAEVQEFLEENDTLYHKNETFEKVMAQAISFQLDPKKPLTIPQKIIRMTLEPEEQKIAVQILRRLKDYGVDFSGRDEKQNTALHLLRPWHDEIAEFLLEANPALKFSLNHKKQSPRDIFVRHYESEEPYYDEAKFIKIEKLLKTPFD
jgi:hypothetical protein